MIAFKALLEQFLPKVFMKCKQFGLAVEFLVYDAVQSFYSHTFSSEIVYRIWDIMIFNFCSVNKEDRKRGIWYLLTPAFLMFKERSEAIENATNAVDIVHAIKQAATSNLNADVYIKKLQTEIFPLFVEESTVGHSGFIGAIENLFGAGGPTIGN